MGLFFLFMRVIVIEQRIFWNYIYFQKITPYEELDQKRMLYNQKERAF
jgi:hypothetical protein